MSTPRIQIYAWGANSHGQTGTNLPAAEELHQPTVVHVTGELSRLLCDPGTVSRLVESCRAAAAVGGSTDRPPGGAGVVITGGGGHSVLLVEGRVFTAGLNDVGQLGRDTGGDPDGVFRPVDVDEPVISAACGWDHTLLLTSSGSILTAGSDRFGQRGLGTQTPPSPSPSAAAAAAAAAPLPLPLDAAVTSQLDGAVTSQVAAGLRHSAAVTSEGRLLVWGDNSRGQLGTHGERLVPTPRLLSTASPVAAVSCGQRHTVLLCRTAGPEAENLQLYGMGDNRRGQLLGQLTQHAGASLAEPNRDVTRARLDDPSLVQLPDDVMPVRVHCGWTHTIVECADGVLRGWGRSDYHQLHIPHATVRQLATGSEHCLALTTDGRLLAWGWDEHGAAAGQLTAPLTSQQGAVTAQEGAGMAQEGAGTSQEGAGMAQEGAGMAQEGAGMAQEGAGMSQQGAGMSQQGAGMSQHGAGMSQQGAGMSQEGAGMLQEGSGTSQGTPVPPVTSPGGVVDVTGALQGRVISVGAGYGCSFAVCLVETERS